jgi:hypothetical protein
VAEYTNGGLEPQTQAAIRVLDISVSYTYLNTSEKEAGTGVSQNLQLPYRSHHYGSS